MPNCHHVYSYVHSHYYDYIIKNTTYCGMMKFSLQTFSSQTAWELHFLPWQRHRLLYSSQMFPSSQSTIINFDMINCFWARFWLPLSCLYCIKFLSIKIWRTTILIGYRKRDKIVLGCWTLADHGHHRRLIQVSR